MSHPMVAATFRLQFEPAHDCWVLQHAEGMVRLNAPAAEILRRCDGRRSVQQIVDELELAFAQPALRDDVCTFLDQARQCGWVRLGAAGGGMAPQAGATGSTPC